MRVDKARKCQECGIGLASTWPLSFCGICGESAKHSVDHPPHYCSHPSGVEVIQITEHMNFCLGNAIKYILRAGLKTPDPTRDLRKSMWYIQRELDRLEKAK